MIAGSSWPRNSGCHRPTRSERLRHRTLGRLAAQELLAAIGDVAHPSWRATSVGVYRLWRDLGYAIGAVVAGITADAFGLSAAMWVVAGLTFGSGTLAAARMSETRRLELGVPAPRSRTP